MDTLSSLCLCIVTTHPFTQQFSLHLARGEKSHYSIPLIFHNFPVESYLFPRAFEVDQKMAFTL